MSGAMHFICYITRIIIVTNGDSTYLDYQPSAHNVHSMSRDSRCASNIVTSRSLVRRFADYSTQVDMMKCTTFKTIVKSLNLIKYTVLIFQGMIES